MSNTATVEDIAANILRLTKEAGRDQRWLSRASQIPYSTLRTQLISHPHRLTVENIVKCTGALGVSLAEAVAA